MCSRTSRDSRLEADAADPLMALDHTVLRPSRRRERSRVAAGAGAEHDHVGLHVGVRGGLGPGSAASARSRRLGRRRLPVVEPPPSASAPRASGWSPSRPCLRPPLHSLTRRRPARARPWSPCRTRADQRVLWRDLVARRDEDLDDRHVGSHRVGTLTSSQAPSACPPEWSPRYFTKRAAAAPSITRWSSESDSGSISRGTNSDPSHTGFVAERTTPDRDLRRVDDRREARPADPPSSRS